MTVRINLLPYRKIRRAERQRQFNLLLVGAVVAGVAVVFLGLNYIDNRIEHQQGRNQRLENAIAKLDKEIEEIRDLKSRIGDVLERKRVVENLQSGRSRSVIVLDEIARQLPEGVFLKSITQKGDAITLVGVADTNARVAALVRNLGSSQWMESPELVEIHAVMSGKIKQSAFTVKVKQKSQQPAGTEK
jgi:type IV pilus assembly protein PilN